MKKTIGILSTGLMFVFAIALANTGGKENGQQPGVMDESTPQGQMEGQAKDQEKLSKENQDKLSKATSCTDENGITHRKGDPEFDRCLQAKADEMKKQQEEQMGGQAETPDMGSGSGTGNGSGSSY